MRRYSTYFDGVWTDVMELDDCIRAIQCRNRDNENRIKYLEEENKKLKDEHYKDEEIQKMQQKLEKMKKDYYQGFPISEEEHDAITKWQKQHDAEVHGWTTDRARQKAGGVSGGRYTYTFIPTTLGTIGTVRCHCGAEFEFSGMDL